MAYEVTFQMVAMDAETSKDLEKIVKDACAKHGTEMVSHIEPYAAGEDVVEYDIFCVRGPDVAHLDSMVGEMFAGGCKDSGLPVREA